MMGTMTTYLQPHEGVIGTDLDGDLLSLDESAVAHRDVIRQLAHHLQTATLVGNPAPVVARMAERLRTPRVGDLVVELSTFHRGGAEGRLKGFGILIAERREWWETDEEFAVMCAEEPDEDYERATDHAWYERATDHAWYVQYGNNAAAVCRWTNCSFLVVPVFDTFTQPVGTPDPEGGVTITRDSLLGSLADSGFTLQLPDKNEPI